jgi:two-component system response regulator GlrR
MTNPNQVTDATNSKILIVDDDPSLLRLIGIRLSAAGYQIESAKNAKIALGRLESFHPQLVIIDL